MKKQLLPFFTSSLISELAPKPFSINKNAKEIHSEKRKIYMDVVNENEKSSLTNCCCMCFCP